MYRTGAPEARTTAPTTAQSSPATTAYQVVSVDAVRFDAGRLPLADPDRQFLDVMLPLAGVRGIGHDTVRGIPYGSMFTALLDRACLDGPVDLTVAAFAVPDFALADIPGIGAAALTGGQTAMFGISDYGRLTTFAALRLGALFARRQGIDRFAVLAADQASLPYAAPTDPLSRADADLAALIMLTRTDHGTGLRVAHRPILAGGTDFAADEVFYGLVGDRPLPLSVVVGAGCESWVPPAPVALVRSAAGQPAAGLWETVATSRSDAVGRTIVIDADPSLGEVAGAWL